MIFRFLFELLVWFACGMLAGWASAAWWIWRAKKKNRYQRKG